MIFYLLFKESQEIKNLFTRSYELVAQTLCICFDLIDDGEYGKAKLEWLALNPGMHPAASGLLNAWGFEENLFTQHLMPFMWSCMSSSCNSPM
jgi:hypothetical protein